MDIKEVCSKLKDKRKELGYDIRYTVEKTKLHPTVIRNIEDGNLEKISPAYIKGFMKIYSSFLKVDLGDSLKEFDSLNISIGGSRVKKEPAAEMIAQKVKKIKSKISPQIIKKILIIVIVVFCLWSFITITRIIFSKITNLFKPKAKIEAKQTKRDLSYLPIAKSRDLSVAIIAKKRCFLKATVDGKVLFKGVLVKGATESWSANNEIDFEISDGSAVRLEVNGKMISKLSFMSKPIKSLKITPSGISVNK